MELDDERWDDNSPPMQFYYAVVEPNVEQVKAFLAQGMSVDTLSAWDESMLQSAARLGRVEVACLLLQQGAAINYQDGMHYTALKLAAEEGQLEMVHLLLNAGADMTICGGTDAGNALHGAAMCGHVEIVRLLLERGADPNALDMDGCTVSYLQRTLFLKERPEATSQILVLLKSAGAVD